MIILKKKTKYVGLFLALLSLFLYFNPGASVYAQSLELTTDVPLSVELEVIIYGEGIVRIGDIEITSSSTFDIKRNTRTDVLLMPNSDYAIDTVILNGENISSNIHENSLVLPELDRRSVLEIYFVMKTLIPSGGGILENPLLPLLIITTSLVTLILLVIHKRKIQSTRGSKII